jgi:ribosomal protein L1
MRLSVELVAIDLLGSFPDFDAAIATPDQIAKVSRIAHALGPRGLVPNNKNCTVTPDVAKAIGQRHQQHEVPFQRKFTGMI